jgi:hypothetical protein
MKKRLDLYCNAVNTDGYQKGHACCAVAKVEGPDGLGYCRAHYTDVARARIAVLEEFVRQAADIPRLIIPPGEVSAPTEIALLAFARAAVDQIDRIIDGARAAVGKVEP